MAAKIKDGLFIGDAETSQSEIFINDNKISNLINLSGREVPNVWASHGLVYLTYNWEDRPDYRLFSGHEDSILTDIVEFVDVSIAHGISVLMFSKKGTGRSAVAACLYLMVKYRWGFEKSYDYVYSKKPDIDLNKGFIQQMFALDMKLVASRQKAYALKHGIENTFKIEPNMTINDIAAMLPPTEAKRWNSWDPAYVLTPNSTSNNDKPITQDNIEEVVTWQKYADSVISALRKKDQIVTKVMVNKQKGNLRALDDAEEELVLIFSFINAKNTISTLPGPYYNAYEVQKQFALRFDSIVFEEDVNWFPTSPTNSRYTYAPKGILKGGTRPLLTAPAKVHSSPVHAGADSKPSSSNVSNNGMGSREDKHALSPPHVGLANPRNSIEIRPSSNATANTTNTNTNKSNNAHGYGDDDLLKYVGVSSATTSAQSKEEPYSHLNNSNNTPSNSNNNNVAQPKRSTTTSAYDDKAGNVSTSSAPASAASADYDRKPMTAEERLRKLMADMERQKPAPSQPPSTSRSSTGGGRTSNNSNVESNSATPSLYDLANMQVHTSTSSSAPNTRGGGGGRNPPQDFSVEDFDDDDDLDDPLAAFDVPTQAASASSSRGSSSAPASSNVASGKTGALRARHDILSSTGTGPSSRNSSSSGYNNSYSTSANNNNNSAQGGRSSLNNTTGGTRQQAWGSSSGNVSNRYASPSSVRSNSHVPSSNSSIASQGSDNPRGGAYVGSGTTSGTQVYRHGSPAPNNRPNPSSSGVRRTTGSAPARGGSASSNNSVGSDRGGSLSGVYGTGLGGSSTNNNNSGRFSPVPSPSVSKSTRYSSPFAAAPSSTSATANNLPQRRGSNTSITSVGSFGSNNNNNSNSANVGPAANSGVRRSVGNASPLRASYGGSSSGNASNSRPASPASFSGNSSGYNNNNASSGVPTKRFSTPTPHDYDPNNNNSSNINSNNGRPGSASSSRNNTPSKATWRF